jgi:hypothetical protein
MRTRLDLILRRCGIIGLVALWSGIGVVTYGTHLKSESPQLKQYEWEAMQEMTHESRDDDPKRDYGPGIALGVILSSAWEFVGVVSVFLGSILTGGLVVLREMYGWKKMAARIGTGILASFALLGVYPNINSGLGSFRWGFDTLGAGEWLIAAGLLLVAVGSFSLTRDTNSGLSRKHDDSLMR